MQSGYGAHPPLADVVRQPQRIHSGETGEMRGPVGPEPIACPLGGCGAGLRGCSVLGEKDSCND